MNHNFNKTVNRKGTGSAKWDCYSNFLDVPEYEDMLPLWVADMDFRCPDSIISALRERVDHGLFGYTMGTKSYLDSIVNWMRRRHDWTIQSDWIVETPGVVKALNLAVRAFSNEGEKVIVQTPVYGPFMDSIVKNNRELLVNPLIFDGKKYQINFEDLELKASDPNTKLIIICNPQNPVSRVWSLEELTRLGDICLKHGVIVVSDEVHGDIIYPGHKLTPFASISEAFANNSIVCTGASKTFNIAGLEMANIIISNPKLRKRYNEELDKVGFKGANPLGLVALEAAYNGAEQWLDDLLIYLKGNVDYIDSVISTNMPGVNLVYPEGTFLCWLDFRGVNLDIVHIYQKIVEEAHVLTLPGQAYGEGGLGFLRVNIACSREILVEAFERISKVLSEISVKQ